MRSAFLVAGFDGLLRSVLGALVTLVCLALLGCGRGSPRDTPEFDQARRETEAWRAKHETDYRNSWSTIAGLFFLEQGSQSAGSGPRNKIVLPSSVPDLLGTFTLKGEAVTFQPAPDADVRMRGEPVTKPVVLRDDGEDLTDVLNVGAVRMVIHRSGARKSLRVWDPDGPLAKGFQGFRWFDIQPEHRVTGRWIPDATPRAVRVVNTFGDLDDYRTEGVVEFTLNGQTLRLRPFTTRPKRLYFVFRDGSSGSETYEAARFLYSDLGDDGTTVLDFNQAYNPPCAFNPFTTCPIPIPENRLGVKILAGEKAYPVHVPLPSE